MDVVVTTSTRALSEVAPEAASGSAESVAELHAVLLDATVYCQRADTPGFAAARTQTDAVPGLVWVFSSPAQLALACGSTPWFSLAGRDLLESLPTGYDLLLDIAGPAPLLIRPSALDRHVTIDVRDGREGAQ